MRFKVRIANTGRVYAVFESEGDVACAAPFFPDEVFFPSPEGYCVSMSQWRKDSFRDAAVHG